MSWKDWPYWLKGGLIGLVSAFIIIPLLKILCPYLGYDIHGLGKNSVCNFLLITTMLMGIFIYLISFRNDLLSLVLFFILLGLIFFGIGALIGRIYGKIKSKN